MVRELQIQLPPEVQAEEAKLMLAIKLYEMGRLSLGQAAKLGGYSKSTFMELLGKNGATVTDYDAEDLEREMNV